MKTKRTENPIWLQAAYALLSTTGGLDSHEEAAEIAVDGADAFVEAIEKADEADRQKEITDADRALAEAREKFPIGSRARIKADGGWGTVTRVEFYPRSVGRNVPAVTISWDARALPGGVTSPTSTGGITLPPEALERIDAAVFTPAEVDELIKIAVEAALGTAKAIEGVSEAERT